MRFWENIFSDRRRRKREAKLKPWQKEQLLSDYAEMSSWPRYGNYNSFLDLRTREMKVPTPQVDCCMGRAPAKKSFLRLFLDMLRT